MASLFNLRGFVSRLCAPVKTATATATSPSILLPFAAKRTFTTTLSVNKAPAQSNAQLTKAMAKAKAARSSRKGKGRGPADDPKIVSMKMHFGLLNPRVIPPPLRMGRNRHLRHWTIHRAWLLFLRQQRDARERNRMRMFQSMYNACEELRLTEGPGTREQGYLYRVAMEKKGIFRHGGVPIEYARAQTESPAREPWNHDWKP